MGFRRIIAGIGLPNSNRSSECRWQILEAPRQICLLFLPVLATLVPACENSRGNDSQDPLLRVSDGFYLPGSRWQGDAARAGNRPGAFLKFEGRAELARWTLACLSPTGGPTSSISAQDYLASVVEAEQARGKQVAALNPLRIQPRGRDVVNWYGVEIREHASSVGWHEVRVAEIDAHKMQCFMTGSDPDKQSLGRQDFRSALVQMSARRITPQS